MSKCENIDGQCSASWCDCDYQRRKRELLYSELVMLRGIVRALVIRAGREVTIPESTLKTLNDERLVIERTQDRRDLHLRCPKKL